MNKSIGMVLLLLVLTTLSASAKKGSIKESTQDYPRLENAIELYDQGNYEEALEEFDKLIKDYPKDYLVNYERALTLYTLERYDDAIKILKKLQKSPDREPQTYQLYGNALDMKGRPLEAIKMYEKGIQLFPDGGCLYLEIGNVLNNLNYKEKACEIYNLGIKHDPNFASNYYRAAQYYFNTDSIAWALIYAETQILLNLNDVSRHSDMAQEMLNSYRTRIKQNGSYSDFLTNKKDSVSLASVKLMPTIGLMLSGSEENRVGKLEAGGVIELMYIKALTRFLYEHEQFDPLSFESLTKLRRYMVEAYFEFTDNYLGNGMYLLDFQKKVIDAGHWEAYNYFLFSDVLAYYCEIWASEHPDAFEAFANWYNQNIFRLDDEKTVGILSVMKNVKPMAFAEFIKFVATLELPYGARPKDKSDD